MCDGPLELFVYYPDQDYSNQFAVVLNPGSSVYTSMVDRSSLQHLLTNQKETLQKDNAGISRSRQCVMFGVTGSQACSRTNSTDGHAHPQMKPESSMECVVQTFLVSANSSMQANQIGSSEWGSCTQIPAGQADN